MWEKSERKSVQNFNIFQKLVLILIQKNTRPIFPHFGRGVPWKTNFFSPDINHALFIIKQSIDCFLSN